MYLIIWMAFWGAIIYSLMTEPVNALYILGGFAAWIVGFTILDWFFN